MIFFVSTEGVYPQIYQQAGKTKQATAPRSTRNNSMNDLCLSLFMLNTLLCFTSSLIRIWAQISSSLQDSSISFFRVKQLAGSTGSIRLNRRTRSTNVRFPEIVSNQLIPGSEAPYRPQAYSNRF